MFKRILRPWRWLSQPLALVLLSTLNPTAAVAESVTLAKSLPPGAIGYAEIEALADVIDRIRNSTYLELVTESSQFQGFAKSLQYRQVQAARQIAETQLGMDAWTLGKKLFGERLAIGVYTTAGKSQPDVVGLLRVADPETLANIQERIEPFLVLASEQIDTSETINGVKILGLNEQAFVAIQHDWLAVSNSRDLFTKAIDLLTGKASRALADDKNFLAMDRQMGSDHLLRSYVDADALNKAAGGRFAPEKLDNPLGSLLFGGILELAVQSPYVGLTLDAKDTKLVLTAGIAGKPQMLGKAHQAFFSNPSTPGTAPLPKPPGVIGGITIFRGFTDWYRHREDLLQDQVLPGFNQFEAGLANLLPGKDFGEDVLPMIGSNLTFVSAPQDYDHLDGEPGVKLPGFGLIVDLAKPEEASNVFQLFFQTFTAILNIEAGQQGREPWLVASETYKGVQISYGRYLKKPTGERLPLVFNFMPASARAGDKFIISSSLGLCRQLVDEVQKQSSVAKGANRNLNIQLYADPIADLLQANQDFFHAQTIQSGQTQQQAKEQFATLLKFLRYLDSLRLSTSVKSDSFQAQMEVRWK